MDGNRLWGKELGMELALVEWSPDGRHLLFASAAGQVHVYDAMGNAVSKLPLYCNEGYAGTRGVHGTHACARGRRAARPRAALMLQ